MRAHWGIQHKIVFKGTSSLNLDNKGRLTIPTKHREGIQKPHLVITIGVGGCLLIYPEREWVDVYEQLKTLSGIPAQTAQIIIGNAEDLEMDAVGRILIPPRLRQLAGLEKEVALVGQKNKFELWSEANWTARTQAFMAHDPNVIAAQLQGVML